MYIRRFSSVQLFSFSGMGVRVVRQVRALFSTVKAIDSLREKEPTAEVLLSLSLAVKRLSYQFSLLPVALQIILFPYVAWKIKSATKSVKKAIAS